MKHKHKGIGAVAVIVIVAAAVAATAAVLLLFKGISGGLGDGEGKGDRDAASQTEETTAPPEITTETVSYYEIVVAQNDYLFGNERYSQEETDRLMQAVKQAQTEQNLQVSVRDDGASVNAYRTLITALKENKISYIEIE